jgi:hypothetical protein
VTRARTHRVVVHGEEDHARVGRHGAAKRTATHLKELGRAAVATLVLSWRARASVGAKGAHPLGTPCFLQHCSAPRPAQCSRQAYARTPEARSSCPRA